jgi:hypothetical protein
MSAFGRRADLGEPPAEGSVWPEADLHIASRNVRLGEDKPIGAMRLAEGSL